MVSSDPGGQLLTVPCILPHFSVMPPQPGDEAQLIEASYAYRVTC